MSFNSSFDIIVVVHRIEEDKGQPDPKILLCIYASAADAAVANPKRIERLSANGLITFLLKVILFLVMDQKVYLEIILIVPSYKSSF